MEYVRDLIGTDKDDIRSTLTEDQGFQSLFGVETIATLVSLTGLIVHIL